MLELEQKQSDSAAFFSSVFHRSLSAIAFRSSQHLQLKQAKEMVFPATGGRGWADMKSITLQVLKGRWFVVFTTFLLMSVSGASYMFGLYSNEIKSTLGYDQTTLNLLSFFKALGSNIGTVQSKLIPKA
jgi:hypothetical protein